MKKNLIASCSVLSLLVGSAFAEHRIDVEYGKAGGESLRLDTYVPEGAGPFPAVILIHGGGWNAGDKSGGPSKGYMYPMHEPLEKAGFAWFSINYRLAPTHRYPACIEDVETAIRWVKAHAAEYRIDPNRIAISGESAGGHLAALAVVRADASTRVAAVVPFYGNLDLTARRQPGSALPPNLVSLFGRETFDDEARKLLTDASPIAGVKPGLPPFLLVHGDADAKVPAFQSEAMAKRLREAGVPWELISVKGGDHGMRNWDAATPEYKEQVVAWLKRTLKKAK
ncbi:MAG TPA: alpha/beta hydrolase [Opitutaceae bacterium]|nr:alpha/beta hydrolase [Opitutaceae bacterium]